MTQYPLGRYVNHDPRSRAFAFDTSGITVASVRHTRHIPVLDQGNLGSCTGNAGTGALGTEPFYQTLAAGTVLDESYAVSLYSDATKVDSVPGYYPPTDTGSDGLSVAKVLKSRGLVSGYQHTFTFDDALKALSVTPLLFGTDWYNNFFEPDSSGIISIGKNDYVAGGHEVVLDEIDIERQLIGATNSWSTDWGVDGRFYIPFDLFKQLLAQQGDIVVLVPVTSPAPAPAPAPDAGFQLWTSLEGWAKARHSGSNKKAAQAVLAWAKSQGYTS